MHVQRRRWTAVPDRSSGGRRQNSSQKGRSRILGIEVCRQLRSAPGQRQHLRGKGQSLKPLVFALGVFPLLSSLCLAGQILSSSLQIHLSTFTMAPTACPTRSQNQTVANFSASRQRLSCSASASSLTTSTAAIFLWPRRCSKTNFSSRLRSLASSSPPFLPPTPPCSWSSVGWWTVSILRAFSSSDSLSGRWLPPSPAPPEPLPRSSPCASSSASAKRLLSPAARKSLPNT